MVPDEPAERSRVEPESSPDKKAAKPLTKAQQAGVKANWTKKANLAKKALQDKLAAERAKVEEES